MSQRSSKTRFFFFVSMNRPVFDVFQIDIVNKKIGKKLQLPQKSAKWLPDVSIKNQWVNFRSVYLK